MFAPTFNLDWAQDDGLKRGRIDNAMHDFNKAQDRTRHAQQQEAEAVFKQTFPLLFATEEEKKTWSREQHAQAAKELAQRKKEETFIRHQGYTAWIKRNAKRKEQQQQQQQEQER